MIIRRYTVLNSKGQVILSTTDEDKAWKVYAENKDAIMQTDREIL